MFAFNLLAHDNLKMRDEKKSTTGPLSTIVENISTFFPKYVVRYSDAVSVKTVLNCCHCVEY